MFFNSEDLLSIKEIIDDNKRSEPPIEGTDIKKIIPKLNNFLPIFKRSISFIQINSHIVYFF